MRFYLHFVSFSRNLITFVNMIPEILTDYISAHTAPEPEYLKEISKRTNQRMVNPRMSSGHVQGRFLAFLSKLINPSLVLELGTFSGYSALCLAEGLKNGGEVITIEKNDEYESFIKENLSLSPLGNKVKLLIGEAENILKPPFNLIVENVSERSETFFTNFQLSTFNSQTVTLNSIVENVSERSEQSNNSCTSQIAQYNSIDIAFIDADKRRLLEDYELVLPLMSKGGIIIIDNTLWDGHIANPEYSRDAQTQGIRKFNDFILSDNRIEHILLPVRDGITICKTI